MNRTGTTRRRLLALLAVLLGLTGLLALPAVATTGGDTQIVGGGEATPGAYPFMAALVDHGASNAHNGQFCGGSVIAEMYVMTAAHCVRGSSASDIDVVIGRHDLSGGGGERIRVKKITTHPDYDHRRTVNDVAVLELTSATSAPTIALDTDGSLDTPGRIVKVIGWGDTDSTPRFPPELQEVEVPLVSDQQCSDAYGSDLVGAVMLCAGDWADGGVDACQGDSGGPLFVHDGTEFVQLGIVSWGDGCALRRRPGVYSQVSALSGWVLDAIGDGGGTPPPPPPPPPGEHTCLGRPATIVGTPGDDRLVGTDGDDVIVGLGGDDVIIASLGDDRICGGRGDDSIYAQGGNDRVSAQGGYDLVFGGPGRDVLRGGGGPDDIYGGGGDDRAVGGRGVDLCDAETTRKCEI